LKYKVLFKNFSCFKQTAMKSRFIISQLAALIIVTMIIALIYATVQQNYRGNANDPQVQIVSEVSNRLARMASVEEFFNGDTIDLAQSLGLFVVLYNESGQPIRSSAIFRGAAPQLPSGVFDFVRSNGEERVTWQPERGTRMAMVVRTVRHGSIGFVAAGRSLREVEVKEERLRWMVFVVWILCMGVIASNTVVQLIIMKKEKTRRA
jgi:hypothetical protein